MAMIPFTQIVTRWFEGNPEDILWKVADDLIEYRLRLGDGHYDIQEVINTVQQAAVFARDDNSSAVNDALLKASTLTENLDVKFDLYKVIVALGYDCPEHGREIVTWESGSQFYNGRDFEDTIIEHVSCAFCGEDLDTHSVDDAESIPQFTPNYDEIPF